MNPTEGTITFTAPEGTTFQPGQDRQAGQYKTSSGSWTYLPNSDSIKDGQRSADGRTYTFTLKTAPWNVTKDRQFRFALDLTAGTTAAIGTRDMTAKLTGTADTGTFDTTATTPIEISAAEIIEGAIEVPPMRQGETSSVTEFTFGGNPFGTGHFTAPTGTTIDSIDNMNGVGTVTAGTIAADGKTATIGSDSWAWGSPVKLRVRLKADQDAPVGAVSDGSFETRLGTEVTAKATVSTTIQASAANGGVAAAESPATELQQGESGQVPFAVKATEKYTQYQADITLTAPEGTTFARAQTVTGQYRKDGTEAWRAGSPQLDLTDVFVSADGKTLTGKFDSSRANGFAQDVGYQQRWLPTVVADAGALRGDTTLGYTIEGTTNHGPTKVESTSPVKLTAANGGVAAAESPATELQQGESGQVPFAVKATEKYTQYQADITLTAPAGTTFARNQTVAGQWRKDGTESWRTNPVLNLTDVQVSADGKTLTGTFDSSRGSGFDQGVGYQQRWLPTLVADADAPVGAASLAYTIEGTTNHGTTKVEATSPVTITEATAPGITQPFEATTPAEGSTVIAPNKQVTFAGKGTTGTQVKIWNYDQKTRLVASATVDDNGNWTAVGELDNTNRAYALHIEYTEPGKPVEHITRTITVKAAAGVEKDFEVTTPAEGSTVIAPNKQVTFAGKGTTGTQVKIWNYDQKTRLVASATVDDNGNWTAVGELDNTNRAYALHIEYTEPGKPVEHITRTITVKAEDATTLPFEVATPAAGSTVQLDNYRSEDNNGEAVVSGTGQTGGKVKVWNWSGKNRIVIKGGEVLTVDRDGNWSGTAEFAGNMGYGIFIEYFAPGADLDGDPTTEITRPFTTTIPTK